MHRDERVGRVDVPVGAAPVAMTGTEVLPAVVVTFHCGGASRMPQTQKQKGIVGGRIRRGQVTSEDILCCEAHAAQNG
jgi:hypothetical protein